MYSWGDLEKSTIVRVSGWRPYEANCVHDRLGTQRGTTCHDQTPGGLGHLGHLFGTFDFTYLYMFFVILLHVLHVLHVLCFVFGLKHEISPKTQGYRIGSIIDGRPPEFNTDGFCHACAAHGWTYDRQPVLSIHAYDLGAMGPVAFNTIGRIVSQARAGAAVSRQ